MQRAEQPVDRRERAGVVLVPGSGFGAVMPVVEERRGDDSFQRTEPQIDVGMYEQALDALQREIGDDGRNAETQNQDGQGCRRPGKDHIDRVTAIRCQPVELWCGMVDTVESPERWNLVAHPMSPVPADLRDHQRLSPSEPSGLLREERWHRCGHHMAGDREHDRQHGGETECSEHLVDDESRGIGRCARPTKGRPLGAKGSAVLDEHEGDTEQQECCRHVGSPPARPHQQGTGDERRPTQQAQAVLRQARPARHLRIAHRVWADRAAPIMNE